MSQIHNQLYMDVDYRISMKWIKDTNPYCANCWALIKPEQRTVDHITPLSHRPDMAYLRANLQMLCTDCHKQKTITRDKKFNNTMQLALRKAGLIKER